MHDFNLTDRDHRQVSFRELVSTGTVIVSNTVDVLSELDYFRYLEGLGHRVIMVDSKDSPLLHMMADTHGIRMETYTDPSRNLIKQLKEQWQLPPAHDQLARLLRFQILYAEGQQVGTWRQPVTDQWRSFLEDKTAVMRFIRRFGVYGTKWLNDQDKDDHVLWNSYSADAYNRPMATPDDRFDQFMKYYNLMPNQQLTEMLKDRG